MNFIKYLFNAIITRTQKLCPCQSTSTAELVSFFHIDKLRCLVDISLLLHKNFKVSSLDLIQPKDKSTVCHKEGWDAVSFHKTFTLEALKK